MSWATHLFFASGFLLAAASVAAQSAPSAPSRPSVDPGDQQVVLTWTSNGDGGAAIIRWEYAQRSQKYYVPNEPYPDFGPWTAISGSGPTTTSHTVTGLTNHDGTSNGVNYSFRVRAVNAAGDGASSPVSNSVQVGGPHLSPFFFGANVDLRLYADRNEAYKWDGDWWYKGDQAGALCTMHQASAGRALLTDLTPGTTYTYTAYSKEGCNANDAIDTVRFIAESQDSSGVTISASDWRQTSVSLSIVGHSGTWWYRSWTEGNPWGKPDSMGACTQVTGSTVTATGLTGGLKYRFSAFLDSGCTVEVARESSNTIELDTVARVKPTSVTLSLYPLPGNGGARDYYDGDWWYKGDQAGAVCREAVSGIATITGLQAETTYTYRAYGKSDCASAAEIGQETFTTPAATSTSPVLTVTPSLTTASLVIANHSDAWWFAGTSDACTAVAAGTTSVQISGGTGQAYDYDYFAYSSAGCNSGDIIAYVSWLTPDLRVSAIAGTSATITLHYNTDAWWHQNEDGGTCTAVAAGTTSDEVTGLTADTRYAWYAYSKSGCNSADRIAGVWIRTTAGTVPDAPSFLSVTRANGSLTATWQHLEPWSNDVRYQVRYSSDGGTTWTPVANDYLYYNWVLSFPNYKQRITISNLSNASTYTVAVRARSGDGDSSWSTRTLGPFTPVAPATPASITVSRANLTLNAMWPAVTGATSYHVVYSADGGASWTAASSNHAATNIAIAPVNNGTTYIVAVRARNAQGDSGWRNSVSIGAFTPPSAPAKPSSVTVTRTDGSMTASWPAVEGATSYHVVYSSDGGASWTALDTSHTTTSILIPAVNSTTYIVAVRARNPHGNSGWRNSPSAGPYVPPPPPATPSSVTVTRGDGTLTASWPAVDGATGYHVVYSSDGGASWSAAASNHSSASITISNVTNSATYIVAVRARNSHGDSGWRNSPSVGPYVPPPPPATPSSVTVTRGDGTLTASWPAVDGATGYHVVYSSDGGASWSAAASNHSSASITISNVTNSATYIVAVRARNAGGDSGWRNSPSVGPYAPPPPATPSSVTVTRGDGTLTASWPAVDGATGYHVVYSSDGGASWSAAASNHSSASITISNVTNSATYIVAVRARNAGGYSGWRNSVPAGPFSAQSNLATMSLARGPSGRLGNLSTLPSNRHGGAALVPLLLSAADPYGRQGILGIVNRSDRAGTVRIDAFDDSSQMYEPLSLSVGAGATVVLRSEDLEFGNTSRGLAGRIGPALKGDWHLRMTSDLDIDAFAYVRHADGFLTPMHDIAPEVDGIHRVARFYMPEKGAVNRSAEPTSLLRLVNLGTSATRAMISGVDARGAASASGVTLALPPGGSRTLTGHELAHGGAGLSGALGADGGTWRLQVSSQQPIRVMSLMQGPSGHLSNLSTAPVNTFGDALVVPLLLSASDARASQGLLRVVNRSALAGSVRIEAFDDGARAYGPVELTMEPGVAVQLTSADLEQGNAAKGLSSGTGQAESGDWRLLLKSDLDIEVLAYVRHADGLVTAMHDLLPVGDGIDRLAAVGAATDTGHLRLMRVVNLGAEPWRMTRPSGAVVELPAGRSVTLAPD